MGNSARPGSTTTYRPQSSAGGGINAVPSIHGRYSSKYLPYALLDFDKQQVFVNAVSGTPENPVWPGESTQYKFDVSRTTELTLSLYIRNPSAAPNAGRQQDIFIGTCRIKPSFSDDSAAQSTAKKDKPMPPPSGNAQIQSGTQWHDIQYGTGAIKIGVKYVENKQRSLKIEDFELLKVVGKGSFGKVMQVMKKDTQRIYALKTLRKQHIISRSEVAHTLAERSVLAQINNPFIVPLKFSFQSPEKLYLVLAFVNGGELFHHLQREQRFDINRSRFYAAELLCALECLHGFGVIYRDLKPENILVDYAGHIALCDFGLCKLDMKDEDKTNTFCGTPEYLAPELLHGHGYTKAVDWWTLGVLLYEMLTGLPPFYDENTNEMYRKILAEPLHFPGPDVVPPAARDLLTRLLDRDATRRLGTNGASEIKVRSQRCCRLDLANTRHRHIHSFIPSTGGSCWIASMSLPSSRVWQTNVIPQTLTANLLQRHQQTAMSMVPCSVKRCNSSSKAGATIALLKDWVMLVAVSHKAMLLISRDRSCEKSKIGFFDALHRSACFRVSFRV